MNCGLTRTSACREDLGALNCTVNKIEMYYVQDRTDAWKYNLIL